MDPDRKLDSPLPHVEEANDRDRLREALLQKAREEHRLQALDLIAAGMKDVLGEAAWQQACQETAPILEERIQGVLSREALLHKLEWRVEDAVTASDALKMQGFLTTWIEQATHEKLRQFVRGVSSNNALGNANDAKTNLVMKVYHSNEAAIPIAHTCFFTMDLGSGCPDQPTFNQMMGLFFEHALTGSGFQMG